eukprot:scaffold19101_cov53-Phaeocystis_antarctica.AAC.7
MFVTLEVSKASGWLNADADCRESKGGHTYGADQGVCGLGGGRRRATAGHAACRRGARLQIWGRARGGAHPEHLLHGRDAGCVEAQRLVERRSAPEHLVHGRDAGGIPVGDVRAEILHVKEELAHVGDGRDVPAGDGAVRRNGSGQVSVKLLDRGHQGGLGRESGRASPRTPARAISSRGEGRGAHPRATDEQLVGVGQGVCTLPRVERRVCRAGERCEGRKAGGGRRPRGKQAAGQGSTADWGQGTGRSAR